MATDNAAGDTAAPMMTLDRRNGSATMDLYRAALGPVHADYYLRAFTRFDAAGRPGTSWNWTAALLTLNWLLFRQLWLPALAYAGALTAAVLLLFGIGPLLFKLPQDGQWALAAVALLLAFAVPGARANAWLYASCNRKMEAALAASTSPEDACTLLARKASARKHLLGLAAGNLSLFGVTAAVMLAWPDSGALPLQTPSMQEARMAPAEGGVVALPVAQASAPVPGRTSQGQVQPAEPVVLAAAPMAAPAPTPAASAVAALPTVPVVAADPVKRTQAEERALARRAQKEKLARAKEARQAKEAQKTKIAQPVNVAASAPASDSTFLINVGLFADPNNARNAYTRLKDAGLPAITQELKSANGQLRTRVRAGPFESQAEADRAADAIRALRLDAAVIRQ